MLLHGALCNAENLIRYDSTEKEGVRTLVPTKLRQHHEVVLDLCVVLLPSEQNYRGECSLGPRHKSRCSLELHGL